MSQNIQSIRGMHDILPETSAIWRHVENTLQQVLDTYGYQEIRLPVVEKTELFTRSIGEVTDIVEKEMYSFTDRNGDGLTLRPEGTAGCLRACLEHGLIHNQTRRLWYMGPMFRHERPQKGRNRQFFQLGVETYGIPGPDIDAELIGISWRFWKALGIQNGLQLQLNSLGSASERAAYRSLLVDYLKQYPEQLDEDSQRRLETNPLRILDSKNPDMAELLANAPRLWDCLGEESQQHFKQLLQILDATGIPYVINPRLVRGLDYYCNTVFEWVSNDLGAQGTVCAGGRYDGLIAQLGGRDSSAMGFALGLERLIALAEGNVQLDNRPHVFLIKVGQQAETAAMILAEQLRDSLPWLKLVVNCGGGSYKSQFKRADKSEAQIALIIGEDEAAAATVSLKYLREEREQETVAQAGLADKLKQLLDKR